MLVSDEDKTRTWPENIIRFKFRVAFEDRVSMTRLTTFGIILIFLIRERQGKVNNDGTPLVVWIETTYIDNIL